MASAAWLIAVAAWESAFATASPGPIAPAVPADGNAAPARFWSIELATAAVMPGGAAAARAASTALLRAAAGGGRADAGPDGDRAGRPARWANSASCCSARVMSSETGRMTGVSFDARMKSYRSRSAWASWTPTGSAIPGPPFRPSTNALAFAAASSSWAANLDPSSVSWVMIDTSAWDMGSSGPGGGRAAGGGR